MSYAEFLASKAIRAKERGMSDVPSLAGHLCPLQLDLIERAVTMWSNPGDVVLSPFMGIGSEGVTSLKLKRKFIGIELKPSYFKHACRYLEDQEQQEDLFILEAAK